MTARQQGCAIWVISLLIAFFLGMIVQAVAPI